MLSQAAQQSADAFAAPGIVPHAIDVDQDRRRGRHELTQKPDVFVGLVRRRTGRRLHLLRFTAEIRPE